MRIGLNFHTTDKYISGVERYSLGIINALLKIDQQNEYVIFTNQPDLVNKNISLADKLTVIGFGNLKKRIARIAWEHLRLPALVKKNGLDLLHCLHYICPCFKTEVPYITTIHDTIAIDHPGWCKKSNALYYNLMMKHTVRNSARIIAVSNSTSEDIIYNFKSSEKKIRTIYPGIDGLFFRTQDDALAKIRDLYELPDKYILFVGNFEPKKNLSMLVKAYELLRTNGLPHKLVLVGKRNWKSKTTWSHLRTLIGNGDVITTGYVLRDHLPVVYKLADAFVFPSLHEGFGFPPLEAMACGTVVVASDKGALKETISNACCVVDPDDHKSIANGIYSAINDNDLRPKLIDSGKKTSKQFDWNAAASQTLSLYREVVGSDT